RGALRARPDRAGPGGPHVALRERPLDARERHPGGDHDRLLSHAGRPARGTESALQLLPDEGRALAPSRHPPARPALERLLRRDRMRGPPRRPPLRERARALSALSRADRDPRPLFASRSLDEWAEVLDAADCYWGRVQTVAELTDDPQAAALGAFAET